MQEARGGIAFEPHSSHMHYNGVLYACSFSFPFGGWKGRKKIVKTYKNGWSRSIDGPWLDGCRAAMLVVPDMANLCRRVPERMFRARVRTDVLISRADCRGYIVVCVCQCLCVCK